MHGRHPFRGAMPTLPDPERVPTIPAPAQQSALWDVVQLNWARMSETRQAITTEIVEALAQMELEDACRLVDMARRFRP